MDKSLKQVAKEYTKLINEVLLLMCEGLNLHSVEELIFEFRKDHPYGEFYLNGINTFCFHGVGCRFENSSIRIDWDFGFKDNVCCGIDPYKLFAYLKDNHIDMIGFQDIETIREEFILATSQGEMVKLGELYYFSERRYSKATDG